ncbi:MAG: hypothetical protein O9329_09415 [Microcystis sp. LE19-12.2C]|uniref:Uncharacterized protein n=1 Tax=Microcystis aeruginosa Ma_OC_H_19870700_S124 TaxID=2486262 RepID=A0A552ATK0_MICAE|nr:hypothetical protein [Microcystis sp. LE19-12.2C]TRT88805.1 MAG: hypothetical protein EWV63_05235 [Microcystis aeruginosa Ma_OC_H_19870700_S124]
MCWSAEVSTVFSILDVAAITVLCFRNQKRDRYYALAAAPIAGQELCQIFLWLNMGTDSSTCNDINVALSLLVRVLVSFLPLTFTVLAIYGSDARGKRWTALIIGIAALFVTVRIVLILVAFSINPRMCTMVGPNHHQIWADYLASYGIPAIDIGNALLYVAIPTLATFLFLRPIWVASVLSAIGPGTLIPLRILLPLEWASVWCWVTSLFLFFGLAEPIIGQAGAKHFFRPIALLFWKD